MTKPSIKFESVDVANARRVQRVIETCRMWGDDVTTTMNFAWAATRLLEEPQLSNRISSCNVQPKCSATKYRSPSTGKWVTEKVIANYSQLQVTFKGNKRKIVRVIIGLTESRKWYKFRVVTPSLDSLKIKTCNLFDGEKFGEALEWVVQTALENLEKISV